MRDRPACAGFTLTRTPSEPLVPPDEHVVALPCVGKAHECGDPRHVLEQQAVVVLDASVTVQAAVADHCLMRPTSGNIIVLTVKVTIAFWNHLSGNDACPGSSA